MLVFLTRKVRHGIMRTGVVQDNESTKCSQEPNVCLSHPENEALDFDVKQTDMGGGVISSFTDIHPPHSEPLFLLACGASPPVLLLQLYKTPNSMCLYKPPMHKPTTCTP